MWLCAISLLLAPAEARADDDEGLSWDPSWPRFRTAEYIATGVMLAGVGVGLFAVPQREDATSGGILFDDYFREELVLGRRGDRDTAVLIGDIFYYGLTFYPPVVDIGIAAVAVHQSGDVAWQMFAIDAQSYALTGLVSTLTQKLIGRRRPFADKCTVRPSYDPDCEDVGVRSQSMLSGHTAMAFTGAGLICTHHRHLRLYGSRAAGAIACATGMAGAVTVGWSRLVADRHYMSDVLSGAAIGLVSGMLLPELLHYNLGASANTAILPHATPDSIGVALVGFQ